MADQAEMYSREALELRIKLLGEHQDTARSHDDLSDIFYIKRDFKSALEQLEKAFEIQKEVLGEQHDTTKKTLEKVREIQSMVEWKILRKGLQDSQADIKALPYGKQGFGSCISLDPVFMEKSCSGLKGHLPTQATMGESTFHTFIYKRWWTVYMRNKKSVQLEEWPSSWVTLLARPTFLRVNTFALPAG